MKNSFSKVFVLVIILIGFESCAQDMNCEKFKNGTFIVSYDSFVNEESKTIRVDDTQTEIDSLGNRTNLSIEWVNNCSYYLSYISGDRELSKKEYDILSKPKAMLIEFIEIKNDTLEFKITIPYSGQKFERLGKMLKVGD